ncbi:RrF2 family transcriptional regulator [Desertibacillus haloalkaliphilus]|uniref:RrF2 family transcriptional regulator n=1 Tax=Desertibacillus haloalkaliphilus TaxID=1328930 RepID=UPI001C278B45|nr:Rrf2 family transcriptional regulator [Desertibacillus haloalkaliphilus]MBU8908012.1 Rrf2 family transcriptional regulator [Desertibacillus haloalkaliphilus]
MEYSNKVRYSLQALLFLAQHPGVVIPVDEIGLKTAVPVPYLKKILVDLKRLGYVQSLRGSNGGYRIIRRPEQLTIGEVITSLEGKLPSLLEQAKNKEPYLLIGLFSIVEETLHKTFATTTLAELLEALEREPVVD